jgi:putative transcriptional regulator
MDDLAGKLLVAAPGMGDPNFDRAVILMVEHNDGGALGLVLNRQIDTRVEDVWDQLTIDACPVDVALRKGGPCPGPVMVVHDEQEHAQIVFGDGLCFTAEPEQILAVAQAADQPRLYFVGYSGWGPGQLEAELDTGSWLIAAGRPDTVFEEDADDGLWMRVISGIDRALAMLALNPKIVPRDPSMN